MRILAIETSCDDTCAAVLEDRALGAGRGQPDDGSGAGAGAASPGGSRAHLLSSVVSSQPIHAEYAGVVPELASREHMRLLGPVVREALDRAGVVRRQLDAVAVTNGPGLIGSLLVGVSFAKALAYALEIPVLGVSHIEAHLASIALDLGEDAVAPPFVGLVASGGHTEIVAVEDWGDWTLLGATRDDAAGEAFDKVAKLLGLGFPGGPAIARLAAQGTRDAFDFPRAWLDLERGGLDMSFSGVKTAVKLFLDRRGWPEQPVNPDERERLIADVAASFQEAVVEVLVAKVIEAARQSGISRIAAAGGVAANALLRERLEAVAARRGMTAWLPSPAMCGDNAAMVGMAAIHHLRHGQRSGYDLAAIPNLDDWSGFYIP
ncbi:MAG: tRNA (adenosine(37)-N6)-threonylcarbamoyltransferase complex transferase subunit TsaD [Candidatus Eisenbacteria bacterium]|nr:tRNA (adenosine(37)-N6)-threonylcarbamoyltransferase complex transferase subunit TsaD [Candidatus Eisenbacteria bacterium]